MSQAVRKVSFDRMHVLQPVRSRACHTRQSGANGNLTTKCEDAGVGVTASACTGSVVTNLTYDALNQLVQVSKTGQPTEQYGYDDQGRRVRKAVGTATSYYSYEGPDVAAEFDVLTSGATPRVSYVHGPNTDDPILRMAANDAYYYHQGREQQLIESNGGALSTGGSSANKINGISPSNPKGQFYRDEATREFGIVKK